MSSDHAMVCLKVKSNALSEVTCEKCINFINNFILQDYVLCSLFKKKKKKAGTFNKIINPDRSSQFGPFASANLP